MIRVCPPKSRQWDGGGTILVLTDIPVIRDVHIESLILAQDERWRRV